MQIEVSTLPNIGILGENLTLPILLENTPNSIGLLKSFAHHIPDFKGKFLFITQFPSTDNFIELYDYIRSTEQDITIIMVKRMTHINQWRNETLHYIRTDWVLFIDNKTSINDNFIPTVYGEIYASNPHFISLPLRSDHGEFLIHSEQLHVANITNKGAACDAVTKSSVPIFYGAASLIFVRTLKHAGMFNHELFLGMEDAELLLRLLQEGYTSIISKVDCFIRNHPTATITPNALKKFYDFSTPACINQSYEDKYDHFFPQMASNGKIKVAIIIDVLNWAFANIAINLLKLKQDKIQFVVISAHDKQSFRSNMYHVLLAAHDCQIIHFMWRGELVCLESDLRHYYMNEEAVDLFVDRLFNHKVISSCVYDHTFLPQDDIKILKTFQNIIKRNYYVSNDKLYALYSNLSDMPGPRAVCPDGIDLKLFTPRKKSSVFLDKQSPVRIGWAGNSEWGENDHKGLNSIIKPVIDRLIKEGYNIQLDLADRKLIWRQQYDMPKYYHSLDIYLCASLNEGTPNTILEAMACGLVVLSTDVGIVRNIFGPLQQAYIVNRTALDFYYKLKQLLDNRQSWEELSLENLQAIKAWAWPNQAENILNYFVSIINEYKIQEDAANLKEIFLNEA